MHGFSGRSGARSDMCAVLHHSSVHNPRDAPLGCYLFKHRSWFFADDGSSTTAGGPKRHICAAQRHRRGAGGAIRRICTVFQARVAPVRTYERHCATHPFTTPATRHRVSLIQTQPGISSLTPHLPCKRKRTRSPQRQTGPLNQPRASRSFKPSRSDHRRPVKASSLRRCRIHAAQPRTSSRPAPVPSMIP